MTPQVPESRERLWAQPGDRLVVRGHSVGGVPRDAEILAALGVDGAPPFRVRWQDDGHESEIFPGTDAYVEHLAHTPNNVKADGERKP